MIVKLLTGHHLEFLSLKGGCTGSSESTLVKMSNCWKSHSAAQISFSIIEFATSMLVKHKTVLLVISAQKMSVTIIVKYLLFHLTSFIASPMLVYCFANFS